MDRGLEILQHALGVDQYGQGEQYRNHFVSGEGSTDWLTLMDLVERGLMVRRNGTLLTGGDDCFHATGAGKAHVAENSPKPPKLTASQRRYQQYLDSDGAFRTFRDFLRYARQPTPTTPTGDTNE